ncbi:hypothetical protein RFI_15264 [Reticulomyxa filosa]|uniref:Uncharacterized protein n=1 Tax=Reticulomyxa filosa TaxID=46433 RepID=X6N6Q1_RETFI|nr:hypothetical protein RFI_15264 [Reticulomyxa filosa]|eukprot:ETO21940.1 hypothetical protein RFI_15264 [Reticulomyxa filosa]
MRRYCVGLTMIGIWCLVTGSFICGIYVSFECFPFFQSLYLIIFGSILFSIIPLWFVFPHKFPWRVRQMVMVLTIASGTIPCVHWMLFATWAEIVHLAFGAFGMFFFYGLGFVFFHYRIPERFAPGKFDIWLHSHQFWHLFVASMYTFIPTLYYCFMKGSPERKKTIICLLVLSCRRAMVANVYNVIALNSIQFFFASAEEKSSREILKMGLYIFWLKTTLTFPCFTFETNQILILKFF